MNFQKQTIEYNNFYNPCQEMKDLFGYEDLFIHEGFQPEQTNNGVQLFKVISENPNFDKNVKRFHTDFLETHSIIKNIYENVPDPDHFSFLIDKNQKKWIEYRVGRISYFYKIPELSDILLELFYQKPIY